MRILPFSAALVFLLGVLCPDRPADGGPAEGLLYGMGNDGHVVSVDPADASGSTLSYSGWSYSHGAAIAPDGTLLTTLADGCYLGIVDPARDGMTFVGLFKAYWRIYALEVARDGTIYGVDTEGGLHRIDRSTGIATQIGTSHVGAIYDIAFDCDGVLWAARQWSSGRNDLYTINLSSGASTYRGAISGLPAFKGIAFGPDGALYAATCEADSILYSIDPSTLAATRIGATGISSVFGLDMILPENLPPVADAGPDQAAVEATGPDGAPVSLDGTGSTDAEGDSLSYAWTEGGACLASGASPEVTLSLGAHALRLDVSDGAGGASSDTVEVTVLDTTVPAFGTAPGDMSVEASSSAGALVRFTAPAAIDLVDGEITADCDPPSGAVFPLGTTVVACTATDSRGNASSVSFTVAVRDSTPPSVTVPADVTVDATGPSGAAVSFAASAADGVGVASFSCVPASGSTFPIGTTAVVATAVDAAGNAATASFSVRVKGAAEQLADLLPLAKAAGSGGSLGSKVAEIQDKVARGDGKGAAGPIGGFINEVKAQTGKKITAAQAAVLIARAESVRATLGL
jgi:hypothetical protein